MTSLSDLSKLTGYSVDALRNLINSGRLPIAVVSGGEKKSYYIMPPKVYEYFGLKIDGYEPPPTVNIDYKRLVADVADELINRLADKEHN